MEYKLEKTLLSASEVVYDSSQEQPVDMTINLPDYCPDIQKILKCQMYPRITGRGITGDRLELDGNCLVKVFYLDAEGATVRCCENTESFSVAIQLKKPADNGCISADTRVEYINCRAANSRRMDIHGAFSLCARVVCSGDCTVTGAVLDEDVEQELTSVDFTTLTAFETRPFSVEEVLELPEGKPGADTVLHASAAVNSLDFKVIPNKVMIKGDIALKMLYCPIPEEGTLPECMEYEIPFTQMVDCGGITDDCRTDLRIQVIACDIQIKNDYAGDKIYFDTQIRLLASVSAYCDGNTAVVSDAYSKKYDATLEYTEAEPESLCDLFEETLLEKNTFQVEGGAERIIDVWSEMCDVTASQRDGGIHFEGKYNICMLAINSENGIFYFERVAEYSFDRPCQAAGELRIDANSIVADMNYRFSSGEVELKEELRLTAAVFCRRTIRTIERMEADETKPIQEDPAALCIYYAEKGERLWEVARTYRSSVDAICRENDLTGDSIPDSRMLLIPVHTE